MELMDLDQALSALRAVVQPMPALSIHLADALYRTLAAPITMDQDDPPFDKAVMDGFAVHSDDVKIAPVTLEVQGQIKAGQIALDSLHRGYALHIATGAPMPPGADAVVRLENTEVLDGGRRVRIGSAVPPGQDLVKKASFARENQKVLSAGDLMTPANVGVAAMAGTTEVLVRRRPRVAFLTTGSELVPIDRVPSRGQIRNTNEWMLGALLASTRVDVIPLGTVADDYESTLSLLRTATSEDVACVTGGASVGHHDFVPRALEQLGARILVRKMSIKPGRPIHVALMPDGKLVFALPGNPVSAFVGFELLVRPTLAAMKGGVFRRPMTITAHLDASLEPTGDRHTYRPARARWGVDGRVQVVPLDWHGSGDAAGLANVNALIERPPRSPAVQSGDSVSMIPVADLDDGSPTDG